MPLRRCLLARPALDPALALEQPVEHVEQLVAGHGPELQQSAQAGVGRVRGEASGGGELGVGAEDAGDDGGEGQIVHAAGGLVQHAFEAQRPAGAEDSGDVAMRQGAADGDGLLEAGESNAAAEQSAEAGDDPGGQVGEVGDGFAANALAVAPSLAEEDGRGAVAVGDGFDVEGHGAGITWKHNIGRNILLKIVQWLSSAMLHGNKIPIAGTSLRRVTCAISGTYAAARRLRGDEVPANG